MKPFSDACEQNKRPILKVISPFFKDKKTVLEIGSGTGQHAVYFSEQLPHLKWLTSDQVEYHNGINMWLEEARFENIEPPILLDVNQPMWPIKKIDAIFSANTVHIMSWMSVKKMFYGIGNVLEKDGRFCLYGPFNYNGEFSSESNARFDQWLKQRNSESGVRDFEALQVLAEKAGLHFIEDVPMPANNRILVWQKY